MNMETLTRDQITDEMIAIVREAFNSNDQITEDIRDILLSSDLYRDIENLRWADNPVDVDAEMTLNLEYFMRVQGLHKRYRMLYRYVKEGFIQQWYFYIRIGMRDTYEERIISAARIKLLYDLNGYGDFLNRKKINHLLGQVEAVNGLFVAYIDDLRDQCGQRIMQFDTDSKVKDYIMNNKDIVTWVLNLE